LRSYATSMPMFANEIGAVRGVATLASLPVRVTNLVSDAVAQALPGQVFQGVAQQGSMELSKTLDEVVPLAVAYAQNPEGTKALMAIHLTKAASNTAVAAASGDGGARSDITSTAVQFGLPIALEPVLAAKLANFGGKAGQVMQSADDVMRVNALAAARQAQSSADNVAMAAGKGEQAAAGRVAVENTSEQAAAIAPSPAAMSVALPRDARGRFMANPDRIEPVKPPSTNRNARSTQEPTIFYRIDVDGQGRKVGISSAPTTAAGEYTRPAGQVRKLEKLYGPKAEVEYRVRNEFENRSEGLDYENLFLERFKRLYGEYPGETLPGGNRTNR